LEKNETIPSLAKNPWLAIGALGAASQRERSTANAVIIGAKSALSERRLSGR
jgi:hypothetical protein